MWDELLLAFFLVMVIEGLLPSLNPAAFKRTTRMMSELDERTVRKWGLVSMCIGAMLIYIFKS